MTTPPPHTHPGAVVNMVGVGRTVVPGHVATPPGTDTGTAGEEDVPLLCHTAARDMTETE